MENLFFKVVCVNDSNPMEYQVLEDVNRGNLDEVHEFVTQMYEKHIGSKWMLIPYVCKTK